MSDKMGPIKGNSRSPSSICPKAPEAMRVATKPKRKINAPKIRIKKASGRDISPSFEELLWLSALT